MEIKKNVEKEKSETGERLSKCEGEMESGRGVNDRNEKKSERWEQ